MQAERRRSAGIGPAKVFIVDDHPAIREGLSLHIARHEDLTVCGGAADIPEALAQIETLQPDVVIVDVSLKSGNGIDLIQRLQTREKSAKCLVYSMHADSLYAERALRAGARGYLNKESDTADLIAALRTILDGGIYLRPETADRILMRSLVSPGSVNDSPVESLSNRELEVFELLGSGLSTAQIAERLHLSVNTVETHRQRIKAKLCLSNANELVQAAVQWVLEHR